MADQTVTLRCVVTCVAAAAWLGCVGEGAQPIISNSIVQDSLGIEILEETLDPSLRLTLEEDLRMGSIDGPGHEQFFQITDLAMGENGDLFVLDYGNHVIRVFASDGTFLRSWGSEGEGPGEFRFPTSLALARDTVIVADFEFYHVFDTQGNHVATVRNPRDRPARVMEIGLYPADDGWRVQTVHTTPEGPATPAFRISRYDPIEATVGEMLHGHDALDISTESVPGTYLNAQPAFVPRTFLNLDPTGRIFRPTGATYEIQVMDMDGALSRILRPRWERKIVTDEIMNRWWDDQVRRMCSVEPEGDACKDFVDKALPVAKGLPRPEFVPPISRVIPNDDGEGGVLVLRRDIADDLYAPDRPPVYDLFGPDGGFRGRFTGPVGFSAYVFQSDALLGILVDELEVQYVVRYRIEGAP